MIATDISQGHKHWGWYVALGVALILVGLFAIWAEAIATLASVVVLGVVLLIAGIAQIAAPSAREVPGT